jgi:hypothetical protein
VSGPKKKQRRVCRGRKAECTNKFTQLDLSVLFQTSQACLMMAMAVAGFLQAQQGGQQVSRHTRRAKQRTNIPQIDPSLTSLRAQSVGGISGVAGRGAAVLLTRQGCATDLARRRGAAWLSIGQLHGAATRANGTTVAAVGGDCSWKRCDRCFHQKVQAVVKTRCPQQTSVHDHQGGRASWRFPPAVG